MRSRVAILVLSLTVPALAASAQARLAVQKLADGIWAAQPDKGANVGWFLYGDGVVAVDSGGDAATAKEMLSQITETTGGKPVRYLVLTHAHADHTTGTRAFVAAGAQVICHEHAAPSVLNYIIQSSKDPADPPPVEKMVPGHGTIGPITGIADTLAYVKRLNEIVQKLIRSGVAEEYVEVRLREPDNQIRNVPLSESHINNALAVYRREKEKLTKPAATPAPPARKTPRKSAS